MLGGCHEAWQGASVSGLGKLEVRKFVEANSELESFQGRSIYSSTGLLDVIPCRAIQMPGLPLRL